MSSSYLARSSGETLTLRPGFKRGFFLGRAKVLLGGVGLLVMTLSQQADCYSRNNSGQSQISKGNNSGRRRKAGIRAGWMYHQAMKTRKHHNNKGERQIKRGKTMNQVKAIAKKLGLPYAKPKPHAGMK